MSQLRKPLTAGAVDEYANEIVARLVAGDDAAALETALRNFDSLAAGNVVKQRLEQVINTTVQTRILSSGQVSVTMTAGGTGYVVGDVLPIDGDGVGGQVEVLTVDGSGVILTFRVTGGDGYVSTATVNTTGVGGADATFTTDIDNKGAILATVRAAIAAA